MILGWSAGASLACAAVSAIDSLPAETRTRLSNTIRTLIAHGTFPFKLLNASSECHLTSCITEAAPIALGLPSPAKNWVPLLEQSIPEDLRWMAFVQWMTAYFDHGDLSTRDLDVLSYVLPGTSRVPSIFNMSKSDVESMVSAGKEAATDLPFLFLFAPQLQAAYRKTFYEPKTAKLLPHLRVTYVVGEQGPSWGPAALWLIQDHEKEQQSGRVTTKLVPGANHFVCCYLSPTSRADYLSSSFIGMILRKPSTFTWSA